eukprot:Gregarina_sp_Poly_1__10390@NODE_745_length_6478_cov_380_446732_g274_i1_p7_GENE_NODE_745_length_6478_cov_380_446732_g274_i1NODE_745_length_6478_cov_380_446732_g274_i1_p7_ORF_typecomplete_len174_score17_70Pyr_redox_2/PF07992_14/1_1e07NAD_binding_8/PF13450_6/0_015DAO/PF01266_24/0_013FMOlike/PF00743_19/0_023NAD_binding_9/PF13454_6/0_043NAD_binding_9/PF13454_6/6_9e03Thi4/PF01946_17/0_28_NODE_745_length_6478_cov_380_446732_g274_i159156436
MLTRKSACKSYCPNRFWSSLGRQLGVSVSTERQPQYRLAICGAGVAGLSTLKALRKKWLEKNLNANLHTDVFEASMVPLGLLRLGVAPDHTDIKQIGENLVKTIDSWEADKDSRFSFSYFGGVEVGKTLDMSQLRSYYDSVIITTGSYAPGDSERILRIFDPGFTSYQPSTSS